MSEQNTGTPDGGQHGGGGQQGERLEGSLTNGGSLPGASDEDRTFGSGGEGATGGYGGDLGGADAGGDGSRPDAVDGDEPTNAG